MVAPAHSAFDRVLSPLADLLDEESAERIVRLQLDSETQTRIDELAAKASAGTLSEIERTEYAEFVEALDVVSILQAKAKDSLRRRTLR